MIAAATLYVAGKMEEDHTRIRDIINIYHKMIFPEVDPLPLGDEYWDLRDSLVNCELFLMRMLAFKITVDDPQKVRASVLLV
ncbi:FAM58A [Cordylochernes scorpioides]|uniref:FAM58A n=1 Tax=Cordylochernes scorpioides TaxID=51811 RepID=A0ABY6KE44_9ARAC|nr:FAM58A [Cordylochernes scorpioides]